MTSRLSIGFATAATYISLLLEKRPAGSFGPKLLPGIRCHSVWSWLVLAFAQALRLPVRSFIALGRVLEARRQVDGFLPFALKSYIQEHYMVAAGLFLGDIMIAGKWMSKRACRK